MALTLKFNLSDIMQQGFTDGQRRVLTPSISSTGIKVQFARRAIEAILERTNQGKDKNNKSFKPYSTRYKKSREFKIYGKTSRVNLKLSGEMQASIHPGRSSGQTVTIAITDPEQVGKARGHINGSGPLPVRDFWGLSMKDQVSILKEIFRVENAAARFEALEEGLQDVLREAAIGAGIDQTATSVSVDVPSGEAL
jgi:hypothetical protein